jgi:hypothetical protein
MSHFSWDVRWLNQWRANAGSAANSTPSGTAAAEVPAIGGPLYRQKVTYLRPA